MLDRVTCEKAVHDNGTEYYTYYTYLSVGDNTTSFVSAVTYKTKAIGATAETVVGSIEYTYDSNGFISSVTNKNALGAVTGTESYTYDALGQLKTVTNGNNVTEYTYDTAGNITSKTVNGTKVSEYTYGDSQWKDLLTSYNGQTITYDAIGNPTKYVGWDSLTWSMGRRLTALSNSTDSITYNYNANGQRVSKTVNGVTTEYYYDDRGALVLSSSSDGTTLYFYPDADGSIGSFSYDGEQYYYVRNAQNDVKGITDKNGAFVAKYTYDEWGVITSITDGNGVDVSMYETHIANLNPYRYRSYFYDSETGFYWLDTRYYDPEIGRFINADSVISDIGGQVIGNNMFAYCFNNPVMLVDADGLWPDFGKLFEGALLVTIGVLAVASVVATGGTCIPVMAAAYSITATAGVVTATIGASEVVESFTGVNPVEEFVGEDNYNTLKNGSLAIISLGQSVMAAGSTLPTACFVAGTEIATEMGYTAIENIATGEKVWATDPTTGETALKRVVQTFVNEVDELVHVYVNGEVIVTTPDHPFYVPQKGWTSAIHLRAGDALVLLNGSYVVIERIQHEILEAPIAVYNFEVEDFHTYYVGSINVLVHNVCSAVKKAQLPTQGRIRYIPPKHTYGMLPRTSSGGYIDRFGNIWVKGPSRTVLEPFEWDVQLSKTGKEMLGWLSRDGSHINVSLKGKITHR